MFDTTPLPLPQAPRAPCQRLATRLVGFGAGTQIQTGSGMMAVESLLAGDMLPTADGGLTALRGLQVVTLHDALAVMIPNGETDRPALVIGPEQPIACPQALARGAITLRSTDPARLLRTLPGIRVQRMPTLRLFQLRCDHEVTIIAHGFHALLPAICTQAAPTPPLH